MYSRNYNNGSCISFTNYLIDQWKKGILNNACLMEADKYFFLLIVIFNKMASLSYAYTT